MVSHTGFVIATLSCRCRPRGYEKISESYQKTGTIRSNMM